MSSSTSNLDSISGKVRAHFDSKHRAREEALPLCREAIRNCATSIRSTHRAEFQEARELLDAAQQALEQARKALEKHPDVFYAGFVHDAEKEYAEGHITLALASRASIPDPDELGVGYPAYMNGMGEAVGEMRRHLLDTLRHGQVEHCEEMLSMMDEIYTVLVTMDYPDGITAGLRRTTDMVRGVVERTRGDLTVAARQSELEAKLQRLQQALEDTTKRLS